MADFNRLIPHILRWETPVKAQYLTLPPELLFEQAKKVGFAYDPDDTGGATMCGVTIGTYQEWCRKKGYPVPTVTRLKNITFDQWRDIMKGMFWDRCVADRIVSQSVAEMLVDWVWTSGREALRRTQKVLGVAADGIAGPVTLYALNSRPARTAFNVIKTARTAHMRAIALSSPRKAKFLAGWLNRINAIKFTE